MVRCCNMRLGGPWGPAEKRLRAIPNPARWQGRPGPWWREEENGRPLTQSKETDYLTLPYLALDRTVRDVDARAPPPPPLSSTSPGEFQKALFSLCVHSSDFKIPTGPRFSTAMHRTYKSFDAAGIDCYGAQYEVWVDIKPRFIVGHYETGGYYRERERERLTKGHVRSAQHSAVPCIVQISSHGVRSVCTEHPSMYTLCWALLSCVLRQAATTMNCLQPRHHHIAVIIQDSLSLFFIFTLSFDIVQ
jgi:hypothetical protein